MAQPLRSGLCDKAITGDDVRSLTLDTGVVVPWTRRVHRLACRPPGSHGHGRSGRRLLTRAFVATLVTAAALAVTTAIPARTTTVHTAPASLKPTSAPAGRSWT